MIVQVQHARAAGVGRGARAASANGCSSAARVQVVVAILGLVVVPPLRGVPAVQPHVEERRRPVRVEPREDPAGSSSELRLVDLHPGGAVPGAAARASRPPRRSRCGGAARPRADSPSSAVEQPRRGSRACRGSRVEARRKLRSSAASLPAAASGSMPARNSSTSPRETIPVRGARRRARYISGCVNFWYSLTENSKRRRRARRPRGASCAGAGCGRTSSSPRPCRSARRRTRARRSRAAAAPGRRRRSTCRGRSGSSSPTCR